MTDRFATLRQGLVGAWCPSSQPGGALLVDRSPYMTNPALTGFAWTAAGNGSAINGNGTTARATVGDLPQFRLTTCTITGWFRVATQGASLRCLFATYSQNSNVAGITFGINIANTSQNALAVVIGKNTGTVAASGHFSVHQTAVNVCDSVLHSCACVIQSGIAQIYVDGAAIATTLTFGTAVAPAYAAANYVNIGTEQTASATFGKYWPGLLDDVRVYDRALAPSEIRLLASQRGIGLVPTRHRRARATTTMWLNVGGVWKKTTPHIRVGGVWKQATPKVRQGGTWR